MAEIKAFKALRYTTNDIKNLVTPPYDIISDKKQEEYYNKSENNVIRLEYGKINDNDTQTDNRYTRAKNFLNKWLEDGILKTDDKNALYIYEEDFLIKGERKVLRGIFSRVKLEEFDKKIIVPHEETLSKAKKDRFELMKATNCNFSPIYLLYNDEQKEISKLIEEQTEKKPEILFDFEDGVTQKMWILDDENVVSKIEKFFLDKQLFIADGHHRYETALNYRNYVKETDKNYNDESGCNFVMSFMVSMEDEGLVVFPTHRMLKNIENFNEENFINKVSDEFFVEKIMSENIEKEIYSTEKKVFGFYTGKNYFYKLTLKDIDKMKEYLPQKSDCYRNLDVSVLHTMILEKYFGIDKENMADQKNLVYTRNFEEAITSVKNGDFNCSFIINATKVSEIKTIASENEKMPQKSTYFWPKLVTGIVMNKF